MRRVSMFIAALSLTAGALSAQMKLPANVELVGAAGGLTQYRLASNGMTILLSPNHASPVVTFEVVYHVGSRNEAPGNTGSAHLLEHMLFNKSTANFGKANGHKTFQEVLYEAGADYSSTNMTTWYDRMNGYSTVPSDKLELAMRIEADRLARGLILDSERQPEMSVVRNEYEIGENSPSEALLKAVVGTAIVAHPYHWSTIGYRSDIEGVTTEKLREHYHAFFWPNNSDAILVGDFDPQNALTMFAAQFGVLPKSDKPIPQVITVEPAQEGERRTVVRRPGNIGLVEIGYMRPGALDPDYLPFDVLANVLANGVNSRLQQALVEKGIATSVSADNYLLRDPYPFLVSATVAPSSTHETAEAAMKAVLYDVAANGISDAELQRAKQQLEVEVVRSRDGAYPFASSLGEAVASANWKWFVSYLPNVHAITAADVKRVAATYLVPDHATVGWFVPQPNAPKVAALAATQHPVAPPVQEVATNSRDMRSVAAAPAGLTFAARTTRRVLPNGIIIDVVENHAVPTVAIRGFVAAGDIAAPATKPALAKLTAEMLSRGTVSRSKEQIAAMLDGAGATLAIASNRVGARTSGSGMSRDLPLLLEILGDELQHPRFAAEELTREQAEAKSYTLRQAEDTTARAMERLGQVVFPAGHPYHDAGIDATLASIETLSLDDLRAFHKERYIGSGMIVSIVGDVDAAKTVALVASALGSIPRGEAKPLMLDRVALVAPSRQVVTMRGKANMSFIFGEASGLRRTDPDYEAAVIANAALGQNSLSSRIGKRVRDTEGLSYSLTSRYQQSELALDGYWMTVVNVAPQNLPKAIHSTREVIEQYVHEGITDDEVTIQKNFFAGNSQVNLGTNGGVAASLVDAERFGFGPRYLDEQPARFRAVTKEQVNAAIRKHLDPGKLSLVVAGDLDTLPE
jgi:zinc protease